ncbi:flightin [Bacillus rossius redtenbacheri]|uniref:flightin n=1 Tax=Bacillus rossius redtenbacheri TaxID=93214 RepID=UPI002FDCF16B
MPEESPALEGNVPAAEAPALDGGADPLPDLPTKRHHDPSKPLTYRYWTRPTHLQYKYLHDYRYNYYDDVIDYLDKRTRGLARELPRPQTWAERALRGYVQPTKYYEAPYQRVKDWELLHQIRAINNYYHYHKYDYITRRYPALLL